MPDLGGGTGAIASRLAGVTLLDVDPVLLEVARAALGVPVVRADPGAPGWADGLPRFDAVVTGTAPRCFGLDRLGALCGEIRGLPRPGGA
ncbi:class I SAM-dependent methyltransferase, partial [Saccharothrix algeriensis]